MDGHFDITNKIDRSIRRCKTRAFAAELFAANPRAPGMSNKWTGIAKLWRDLADLQERTARSGARIAKQFAELKAQVGDRECNTPQKLGSKAILAEASPRDARHSGV